MKTDTNRETGEPQVDDSTGLTRRASMGLLGAAGLGALTGAAAATPPEGQGSQP